MSYQNLPKDVIYSFQICRSLHDGRIQGAWNVSLIKARGDVHPGVLYAASVVLNGTLYIIGGKADGWNINCVTRIVTH